MDPAHFNPHPAMSVRIATLYLRRNRQISYEEALTFGFWRTCQALCVVYDLPYKDHTVDIHCRFSYSEGKYVGEVVHVINKRWVDGDLKGILHGQTYVYVATKIDNDHCTLMNDLKIEVLSITDNNRLKGKVWPST